MTLTPLRLGSPGLELVAPGAAPALVTADGTVSRDELLERVTERRHLLGPTRRLVALEGSNRVEAVVDHLAALAGGHPVLLVPPGLRSTPSGARLLAEYDPDVVLAADGADGPDNSGGSDWSLDERRTGTRHDLHPDLALLLGTSGSSGTPRQVRLSQQNLRSNASAIAEYLQLGPDDRAATSLPLHYCYGLSVLHSHLLAGASVWLTEESVIDETFWSGAAEAGVTSFAGVPHTFDLLEQSGRSETLPAGLRQITQAGGAMPPEKVRAWARRGAEHGVDFVVMYGATEATARMAYLPPHLTERRPETIGIPIPGGDLRLEDGELVYSGPNVMLGYADGPDDLALGRTVHELRTGDLAIQHDDGLFQITGRRTRIAKLLGLRVDLDHVERLLLTHRVSARVLEQDGRLAVLVRHGRDRRRAQQLLAGELCLPAHAIVVVRIADFPLTGSGKTDYPALAAHVAAVCPVDVVTDAVPETASQDDVRAMYAAVLGRPDARPDHSFIDLGGDSLSFVEVSLRLERMLGQLPHRWQERSIGELTGRQRRPRRHLVALEVPIALRALAIVLVVGSHTEWFNLQGGAHLLLALVGLNLARFQLAPGERRTRVRRLGASLRDLMVPSVLWIGGVALLTGMYTWPTALMLNGVLGPPQWTDQWQFWFLEAAAWHLVALAVVLSVPRLHLAEQRRPWRFGLVWLALAMLARLAVVGVEAGPVERYSVLGVAWLVPLGYLATRASGTRHRLLLSALIPLCTMGFFGETARELVVVVGLLLVVWVPRILLPRLLARGLGTLASASLFIYLTHWVVYPPLDADHDVLAALASFAVGIGAWRLYGRGRTALARRPGPARHAGRRSPDGRPTRATPALR